MKKLKLSLLFLAASSLMFATAANAAGGGEAILLRINSFMNVGVTTLMGGAYLLGIAFLIGGIYAWKKAGKQNNQPGWVAGAISSVLVGIFLIWVPSSAETGKETIFGSNAVTAVGSGGANTIQ